jgi:hypothetical protein
VVGERETLGVIEAGDVGVLEAGLLARQLVASGEGKRQRGGDKDGKRAAVFSSQNLK